MPTQGFIQGLGAKFADLVTGRKDNVAEKTPKPQPMHPELLSGTAEDNIKKHLLKYYQESSYEKIPLARKWTRNSLLYQGYQDMEWSGASRSFETDSDDYADYAFPNNHFRSRIIYGVSMYLKNPPKFSFAPTADDPESQAIAQAAEKALPVIQKNINYESMRMWEALHLRLYGNAFRYSYYSLDPRYGTITVPVMGAAEKPFTDPDTGESHVAQVPQVQSIVEFPRGQEVTDVVHPLEVYIRGTAFDLHDAPYVLRARLVDKKRLQASFPNQILGGTGRFSDDLAINYKALLSELSGDTVNPVAWYSNAAKDDGVVLVQGWIRPAMYFDDPELSKKFPDGLYAAMCGNTLLETRNESLDDHWTHVPYKAVPGRFWGDGDDDLVPKQLQLNTMDQLIAKNIAYNSVPQTWISNGNVDKDSISNDPGEVNVVNNVGGRDIRQAVYITEGHNLAQEVYSWRNLIQDDMAFHSNTGGSAIGQHQPGVDTLGGQQMMAQASEENQSPMYVTYKEMNESWIKQMLKIAAENWLDDRIAAVQGMNGQWEWTKLKGASLDPDRVIISARILPVDYGQQQSFAQAVATGVLNPQDPRVVHKAMELYDLPMELDKYNMDSKAQWKEIDRMKLGNPVPIRPFIDDDSIHADICRTWLNSDEAEKEDPAIYHLVYQHMMQHLQHAMMMQSMMAQDANTAQNGGQPGQPTANGKPPVQQPPMSNKPPSQNKGQEPGHNKTTRAMKGQAAKPKTSQPSSGNQHGKRRGGRQSRG